MSDDLVKRLRNTPNWIREEYGHYKDGLKVFDRAPFEAADRIAELEAALLNLIEHTLDCELELDKLHGLGNGAGGGTSSVLCEAHAVLEWRRDAPAA